MIGLQDSTGWKKKWRKEKEKVYSYQKLHAMESVYMCGGHIFFFFLGMCGGNIGYIDSEKEERHKKAFRLLLKKQKQKKLMQVVCEPFGNLIVSFV